MTDYKEKISLNKDLYYIKLQQLVDKVKDLKQEIQDSNDTEKITYLKLALEGLYEEIRYIMKMLNEKSN